MNHNKIKTWALVDDEVLKDLSAWRFWAADGNRKWKFRM